MKTLVIFFRVSLSRVDTHEKLILLDRLLFLYVKEENLINKSENQRHIFLSSRWKLAALKCFNLFETLVLLWKWINLI